MRQWSIVLSILTVGLLVGCSADSDPATDVTYKSATLHGTLNWSDGDGPGETWFEYKTDTGAWQQTPHDSFPKMSGSGSMEASQPVSGLHWSTHYVFRVCGKLDSGPQVACYDRDGSTTAGNYDDFTTDSFATVTPKTAASLRASFGLNTRLAYQGTPHAQYPQVKQALLYTGAYSLRDGLWPEYDPQWSYFRDLTSTTSVKLTLGLNNLVDASRLTGCDPPPTGNPRSPTATEQTNDHCAAEAGLPAGRNDVRVFDPDKPGNGDQCLNCKLADLDKPANASIKAALEVLENVNEPDYYTVFVNWPQVTRDYQQWLWSVKQRPGYGNVKVAGPSMATGGGYQQFAGGELAPYMDRCTLHPYPGDGQPGASVDSNKPYCDDLAPGKPLLLTEMGWHQEICGVDVDGDGNNFEAGECIYNLGVNAAVQAAYTVRAALEHYRKGVLRTDFYTIVEQWCGEINDGNLESPDWGWYSCTWGAKQVADAMHRFTDAVGTGSPTLTPLAYRLDASPSSTQIQVFRRSDGKYVIAIHRNVSMWANHGPQSPALGQVKLTLPDAVSVQDVRPVDGAAGATTQDGDQFTVNNIGGAPVLLVVETG
jgi:hypothetical protein